MTKPKHRLFLDTNIYLSFYRLSDSDVKVLGQLVTLVKHGEVKLYLTTQVSDEFHSNREGVVAGSLKSVKEQRLNPSFPRMFVSHEAYGDLQQKIRAYEDLRRRMLAEITEAAFAGGLSADKLIAELFELAEIIPLTDELWEIARQRYDLRKPPGKGPSYGDAVHWVSLLAAVPDGEDLLLVSEDGDFESKLDSGTVMNFLRDEWQREKDAKVTLYSSLPEMFHDHYPDIYLEALEQEMAKRALAVRALVGSENFEQTHLAIADASEFTEFLPQEVEDLLRAAITNSQIEWIHYDPDVFRFFTNLARRYQGDVEPGLLARFQRAFGIAVAPPGQ
jgi:hypothetical protein